ncbi:MAG: hypothetical protein Q9207_002685 [Kuettlingeria erythrocarpa]
MSGYGKLPDQRALGYAISTGAPAELDASTYPENRPLYSEGYLNFGQHDLATHRTQQLSESYEQYSSQPAASANAYYETRTSCDARQTSCLESIPQGSWAVDNWNPQEGSQGTPVYIYIKSNQDLSSLRIALAFGAHQCPTSTVQLESRSPTFDYAFTTLVPAFLSTQWRGTEVPVRLHFQNASGVIAGSKDVGLFSYLDCQGSLMSPPQSMLRKRKLSLGSAALSEKVAKRTPNRQMFSQASSDYISASCPTGASAYSSFSRQTPRSPSASSISSYGAAPNQFRRRSSTYSGGSMPSFSRHTSREPAWSAGYAGMKGAGMTETVSAAASAMNSPMLPSSASTNPPLVRELFIPPAHRPHAVKATLRIYGDLDSMTENWTANERHERRRLVEFWRSQNGNIVESSFKAVTAEVRSPRTACISCIWWEEQGECFVTSVDAISLLESLVAQRFGVDEKNRVRRNFEGTRPITIFKKRDSSESAEGSPKSEEDIGVNRIESEAFFKLVMAFPDPKPRHIEKDIKVFPWKTLGLMLMKVMGKYRADQCAATTTTTTINIYQQERAMEKMKLSYDMTPTVTRLGAYAPTSQPDRLTPHTNINVKPEKYPNSPQSTSNSTKSSSSSWQSTTTSPKFSHGLPTIVKTTTGQISQLEPLPSHNVPSIFAQGAKYSGLQYPYAGASQAVSHGGMQATTGSQASWDSGRYDTAGNVTGEDEEAKPPVLRS